MLIPKSMAEEYILEHSDHEMESDSYYVLILIWGKGDPHI
jgi:hypothetical protein